MRGHALPWAFDVKRAAFWQVTEGNAVTEASNETALQERPAADAAAGRPIAVEFSHVTKEYHLYPNDQKRILGLLTKRIPYKTVHANNDLSFTIHKGEAVAFIGPNGAGKSTALKIITGVVYPTSGTVTVNGRVSALLELAAGFDGQLTGRENIDMRGQVWGLSPAEIEQIKPQVIEFAELGDYIDQPLRTYSSGMRARLGFAFASSIRPDILIVDEALAVGDRRFSQKCRARVKEIMAGGDVTVLFVTHSLVLAKQFCTRGIVIDKGTKLFDGDIAEAIAFYEEKC